MSEDPKNYRAKAPPAMPVDFSVHYTCDALVLLSLRSPATVFNLTITPDEAWALAGELRIVAMQMRAIAKQQQARGVGSPAPKRATCPARQGTGVQNG